MADPVARLFTMLQSAAEDKEDKLRIRKRVVNWAVVLQLDADAARFMILQSPETGEQALRKALKNLELTYTGGAGKTRSGFDCRSAVDVIINNTIMAPDLSVPWSGRPVRGARKDAEDNAAAQPRQSRPGGSGAKDGQGQSKPRSRGTRGRGGMQQGKRAKEKGDSKAQQGAKGKQDAPAPPPGDEDSDDDGIDPADAAVIRRRIANEANPPPPIHIDLDRSDDSRRPAGDAPVTSSSRMPVHLRRLRQKAAAKERQASVWEEAERLGATGADQQVCLVLH